MSGHTKGPWTVTSPWSGFSSIHGADGGLVFGIAAGGADEARSADECEANARLIAAAPDLLEAVRGALSHCGPNGYLDCGKPATDALRAALLRASAAEGAE